VIGSDRLTPHQERDLVVAAEAGDSDASRQLVDAFLPAIARLAQRFPGGIGVERQELVQEGVAGLLFAAQRYDFEQKTPFWAYASFWVRKAMQELVAELSRPVCPVGPSRPRSRSDQGGAHEHVRAHRVEPTNEELSRATGFTLAQLGSLQA